MRISGYIGENSDLFAVNLADISELTVDFANISYINSIGIKHWILWVNRFPEGITLKLKNCPSLVVNQANIVLGFLPEKAYIESFYVPYFCNDCSAETTLLLHEGEDYVQAHSGKPAEVTLPENVPCAKCKASMEPDVFPEKYFSFLDRSRKD